MIGITERGDAALDIGWLPWVKDGNPAILITKDPTKLCDRLHGYHIEDSNIIVHCTITCWGGSVIEPNVPAPEEAMKGYRELIKMLGRKRVILRIDPIIPTSEGIYRAKRVAICHEETRIRISFLDNYRHVKKRFKEAGLDSLLYSFHAPLEERKEIHSRLESATEQEIEVCGEPGFSCTGCISAKDCKILRVAPIKNKSSQRSACACLAIKKELLNNRKRCFHNCIYCYWKD